ncbi:MAG: hypothetical protein CL607_22110 [Anaerolineaceae bacterium]|nr:hypothetical protein [Anaerolineaceae bacterium]|tara:strand:+ start:77 stop:619 length:543 start_codon:yes stop_codon:yes gene_type:complete
MKKKKHPSTFLKFGEFDLAFESITPGEYIQNMQDEARLRYRDIKLLHLQADNPIKSEDGACHVPFTLEMWSKASLYATGEVTQDMHGHTRVHGYIHISRELLAFTTTNIVAAVLAVFSGHPIMVLMVWAVVMLILYSVMYVSFLYMRDMLLEHLQDPRHLIIKPEQRQSEQRLKKLQTEN